MRCSRWQALSSNTLRITFGIVLGIALITAAAQATPAQTCPGSNLFYIVRDTKGAIIDPAHSGLKYEGGGTKPDKNRWNAQAIDAGQLRSKTVPTEISRLNGKVALRSLAWCNFQGDMRLSLTLGRQTMNLLFHMPSLPDTVSKDFVVDSVPFKPGDYEITLSMPADIWVSYYRAGLWKKH